MCDEPHDGTTMHLSMMNETQFVGDGVVGQFHRANRDIFEFAQGNSAIMNATVSATVEDMLVQRPSRTTRSNKGGSATANQTMPSNKLQNRASRQ